MNAVVVKEASASLCGPPVRCAVCDSCETYRANIVELTIVDTLTRKNSVTVNLCERHAREAATELMAAAAEAACRRIVGYAMEREE